MAATETVDYQAELSLASDLVRLGGAIMLRYFDSEKQTETKSDGSPVTIADKMVNELFVATVTDQFPNDSIISEEGNGEDTTQSRLWLGDPIDGTTAYVWGLPTAMSSLGLTVSGRPVVGAAYDPFQDKLYTAIRGQGSFCNGRRLRVNQQTLDTGIIAVSSNVKQMVEHARSVIKRLAERDARMAMFSGAVFKSVLVASGRFAAYIEHGVGPYDLAAIDVIVSEAGGRVTGLRGETLDYAQPFSGAIVSNGVVHDELVRLDRPL